MVRMKTSCGLILSRGEGPSERGARRFIATSPSTRKRLVRGIGAPPTHRIAQGGAGCAKMLRLLVAIFVIQKRGVSHDSRNATVRIPILRQDRDRDRPVLYCSHCGLDTEAVGSLSSE